MQGTGNSETEGHALPLDDSPQVQSHPDIQNARPQTDPLLIRYERAKRRVYIAGILLACAALFCAWVFRAPWDINRAVSMPVFILVLLALAIVIWQEWMPLRHVETLLLVAVCAMPLPRQIWLFHMTGLADEQWLRLLGNTYWATSAVVVAVFIIGNRRRSLIAGAAVVLASAVIATVGLGTGLARGSLPVGTISYVAGSLLFLTAFLVLMSVATIMRDQWHSAINRAAVFSRWAMTDELTGLANRRAGTEILARQCAIARRQGSPQSIIMGDLDGFKRVNDRAGHALGDAVLTNVAKKLQETVRETDAVARWGGEEFLIIASNLDLEGAHLLAERCRRAIEAEPMAGDKLTMTFGVAQYRDGDTRESLLARADTNLYAGKKAGRNRVESQANTPPHGEPNPEAN